MVSRTYSSLIKGLAVLAISLGFASGAWATKYIVTIDSPLTFQLFKRAHMGSPIRSEAFQMLSNSGAKVEDLFDQVQMIVVEADSPRALEELKGQYGIADIEEEMIIPAPKPLPLATGGSPVKESIGMPWGIEAVRAPEAWPTSNRGRGVRVMVLDTGIDRDHPNLASRFEKGRNFAGVDMPNAPYDYFDNISHGTHVAGTIAADGAVTGLVGVAPEAKILSARVCSTQGCPSTAIIGGVNWGIQEKVDVMNLSLGGPFPSDAARKAYQAAANKGIVVVAASGNDGVNRVSFPAAYPSTIAVGAVDENIAKAGFSQWGPELDIVAPGVNVMSSVPQGTGKATDVAFDLNDGNGPIQVESLPVNGSAVTAAPVTQSVVFAGLGKPEDFPSIDVRGKIALVRRGEIAFGDKVKNSIAAGAVGVILFNNEPGILSATLGEGVTVNIPVAFIAQDVGEEMMTKTNLSGTVHSRTSDFEKMQGTSMATPHMSGVAALVKAVNKQLTAEQVRDILKSTATALTPNNENQFGAGLVDAYKAVNKAAGIEGLLPATGTMH
ncbi:MAG: S8 family serine peptidase [Bdellovibrionaceae bacterium]|nr:S8 family serine peptidase [Bdellovibrionales bacterium]MCB9084418.1 S8 family serine peptidase [Pseudobdellovibrionaceae bacterium]